MQSAVKEGFDEMLKGYAEYLQGSLTYVKHPTDKAVHTYYINLPETTVVVSLTEIPCAVTPQTNASVN